MFWSFFSKIEHKTTYFFMLNRFYWYPWHNTQRKMHWSIYIKSIVMKLNHMYFIWTLYYQVICWKKQNQNLALQFIVYFCFALFCINYVLLSELSSRASSVFSILLSLYNKSTIVWIYFISGYSILSPHKLIVSWRFKQLWSKMK